MGYPRARMLDLLKLLGGFLAGLFRSQAAREAEIAFLHQQLLVLKRSAPARLRLRTTGRLIFVWPYRLFPSLLGAAASEARAAGHGGVVAVSRATSLARSTIDRGLADLRSDAVMSSMRVRRPGGGGKPAIETQPGILAALNELVQSSIRGDPEAPLMWVSKSQRHLSAALAENGFTAGQKLVGRLLRRLGFSLQANAKTREGASHPDRNAQFEHINAEVTAFQAAGGPAISVDTKKKELVGDFKNGGRELRPKGQPEPVRVHDFIIPELGKAVPYGVHDITANTGWVNLGINHDTAAFDVESIRRWWLAIQRQGGCMTITVCHLPRNQQMEPHRAPTVCLHHPELAW